MMNAATTSNTPPATFADDNVSEAARLIPIEEVMSRSGMRRTAIYARVKAATFPAPAKVGSSSRWLSTEVDEWVRAVVASRPKAKVA